MSKVHPICGARYLGTGDTHGEAFLFNHTYWFLGVHGLSWFEKTWPSSAALKLVFAREQDFATSHRFIKTFFLIVIVLIHKRSFSATFVGNLKLVRRQL